MRLSLALALATALSLSAQAMGVSAYNASGRVDYFFASIFAAFGMLGLAGIVGLLACVFERRVHIVQRLVFALLTVAVCIVTTSAFALDSDGTEPDPVLTPGAVRTTDRAEICDTRTKTVRNVSGSEKLAVFHRYGMIGPSGTFPGTDVQGPWEVDHLISLELGGSNDITNLWPESFNQPMGAHEKDALENRLHKLVCGGEISVEDAQHAIATDWIGAYRKYVAP